ncbi:MAG: metallopeptidase family protein [Chloroflexi bacterium]|nr:metallopeptidase family protein [Chloroflexota bacterium]
MKHVSMSRRKFEQLVERALISLPEEFSRYLENVAIMVEEEPPRGMEEDTMGLYEGVPLTERGYADPVIPDRIVLYQKSIERACRTSEDVEREVRETVLHEVGHFFGLDEPDLH